MSSPVTNRPNTAPSTSQSAPPRDKHRRLAYTVIYQPQSTNATLTVEPLNKDTIEKIKALEGKVNEGKK